MYLICLLLILLLSLILLLFFIIFLFFFIFIYFFIFYFFSLAKQIDYWRERSTTLQNQLEETGKSYDSKIEHVLVAQEGISEQQIQVLRELSAALAAQQALAAQAAAAAGEGKQQSPSQSGSPSGGNAIAASHSPMTPDQVNFLVDTYSIFFFCYC